jgi:hypothetical protein
LCRGSDFITLVMHACFTSGTQCSGMHVPRLTSLAEQVKQAFGKSKPIVARD